MSNKNLTISAKSPSAFSLVELIVAVAITGILLVGVSAFFAQHLNQLNDLGEQNDAGRAHFLLREMLRKKLMQAEGVVEMNETSVTLKNRLESSFPFTILGLKDGKVVLKDFFPMGGMAQKKAVHEFSQVPHPTGMAYSTPYYYINSWSENAIYVCQENADCTVFAPNVVTPLGLSSNTTHLFVTEAKTGQILKINRQNSEDRTMISNEFKKPTGVAYYNKDGHEYLFVADSGANVVKRVDLQTNKSQIIAGLTDDPTCTSSALFCGLNFPTSLFIDGDTLYIADTGNGRILKISEPETIAGAPSGLTLEFEIDPNLPLQKIIITGEFNGESLNAEKTNLVGNNYNSANKTFSNPVFQVEEFDDCSLNKNLFTQQPLQTIGLKVEDKIQIGSDVYTITGFKGSVNCQSNEEEDPVYKYETEVELKPSGKANQWGYGHNPGNVKLAFNGVNFSKSGFQTVRVQTYDIVVGPAETDEILVRVGDGTLGSLEDEVEIWMEGLTYPHGLSVQEDQLWVTDGEKNTLTKFSLKNKEQVEQINLPSAELNDFAPFDLISTFPVNNFNLSNPKPNLLQLSFEANLGEGKTQEYVLNKVLSVEE